MPGFLPTFLLCVLAYIYRLNQELIEPAKETAPGLDFCSEAKGRNKEGLARVSNYCERY